MDMMSSLVCGVSLRHVVQRCTLFYAGLSESSAPAHIVAQLLHSAMTRQATQRSAATARVAHCEANALDERKECGFGRARARNGAGGAPALVFFLPSRTGRRISPTGRPEGALPADLAA